MIRTGNLDFVLVKPIDTQFLISCEKMELAMINQSMLAIGLLIYALVQIGEPVGILQVVAYLGFVVVGVAFFYSLMIAMASTSIWLTRNQGLYDFWFYITVFARYPRSIYDGVDAKRLEFGEVLQGAFTFVVPILLVVTVPARLIAKGLSEWQYPLIGLASSAVGLIASRMLFQWSLRSYRSSGS
jgi:ABC-2 type transport system permease protein